MPEIAAVKTEDFECVIWARDIVPSQDRIGKTMQARGGEIPLSVINFSPPLKLYESQEPVSNYRIDAPVFFENKQYDIEFIFRDDLIPGFSDNPPRINHRLRKFEEAFHYSRRSRSLRASINTGNDIGWLRFELEYPDGPSVRRQFLSIEVLPTKMDMPTDLNLINEAIDAQYPLWRFTLAEKTHQRFDAVKTPLPEFLLLWLAQFESLQNDLNTGINHILNSPHARLVSVTRIVKAEKLKGRLTRRLETDVRQAVAGGLTHRRFRIEKKQLSIDTPENRFIKSIIKSSIRKLSTIRRLASVNQQVPDNQRLSDSFLTKLHAWQQPLIKHLRSSMFQEIGEFTGLSRESLVLQQKSGYAKVYRVWQQLKWHLTLLGQQADLSLRNVAELYEVWCFLEVRNLILEMGFTEVASNKAQLKNQGLGILMKDGLAGAFCFTRSDGITLQLAHEPTFRPASTEIRSWLTAQKPDILLKATLPDGSDFIWLFDAKYRIDSEAVTDLVPDDAINQLHRYRDALIHQHQAPDAQTDKTRPVFGAFALYPGFFDQANETNPYAEAIEAVGIGAFSLLPGGAESGNYWLKSFLAAKLGGHAPSYPQAESDRYFIEESARIPYKGIAASRYTDLVIAASSLGPSRSTEYIRKFEQGEADCYHMRIWASERQNIERHIVKEARFLAVALDVPGSQKIIKHVYPVINSSMIKRGELNYAQTGTEAVSNPEEIYWFFELGRGLSLKSPLAFPILQKFEIKLTGLNALSTTEDWAGLPTRYKSNLGSS